MEYLGDDELVVQTLAWLRVAEVAAAVVVVVVAAVQAVSACFTVNTLVAAMLLSELYSLPQPLRYAPSAIQFPQDVRWRGCERCIVAFGPPKKVRLLPFCERL